ncbi:MAG: S-layer homology domain-containing protein, partial [Bacillota bacterium]
SFLYQPGMPAWDAVTLTADAVAALAGVPLLELPPPAKPPSGGTSGSGAISIKIKVLGLDGAVMYPERTIQLGPDEQTPLEALKKITTNVETAYGGAYVAAIDGLREKQHGATSGWSYKVNGEIPQLSAASYLLHDGDYVEWFYVRSVSEAGGQLGKEQINPPVSGDLQEQNKSFPEKLQTSENTLTELAKINQSFGLKEKTGELGPLNELTRGVVLTGERPLVDLAKIAAQKRELAQNKIELHQKVTADLGAVLADANAEIALAIPAKALQNDTEITVKKIDYAGEQNGGNASPPAAPPGYRQISAIYSFGPAGTTFDEPATLSLRLVIPPLVRAENLALAWYDRNKEQWKAVPAVVDLPKGLILARLKHFSDFAVFAREEKKSFADVTADSFGWAKETIETLAGAGIVAGVDGTRFEPGRPVTRAEFTALLVKALAMPIPEKPAAAKAFKDVQDGDWFAGAATAAAQAGLVKGYADGTFRPHSAISREEAAAILARVMNLATTEQKLSFADRDKVSSWARASVAAAAAHGLVKGFPDGTFKPAAALGRAECAALVYRMLAID